MLKLPQIGGLYIKRVIIIIAISVAAITLLSLSVAIGLHNSISASEETNSGIRDQTSRPDAIYHRIFPEGAKQRMASGEEEYILIDVRTAEEYAKERIPGAILIPDTEISSRATTDLPDKSALIFIYCQSGGRSARASKVLVELGYTNVYDLGGIADWPYDTTSD